MTWLDRRVALGVALACGMTMGVGSAGADGSLADGVRLYEALDYETAQIEFEAVLKDERAAQSDIGSAAMYLGLVHYNLGNTVAAETYFGVALTFDDSIALPKGTSPKIGTTFELIRKLVFPVPRSSEEGSTGIEPVNVEGSGTGRLERKETPEPVVDEVESGGLPWWTITSGAATAVTGGLAIYFAMKSRATKNTIEDEPHSRQELDALQSDLNTETTTANLLLSATGAFALSTAAVYFIEKRSSKAKERRISVGASATGSSAWVGAAWQF